MQQNFRSIHVFRLNLLQLQRLHELRISHTYLDVFSMLRLSLARTFYVSHLAKAKLKSLYFRVTEFRQHHENIY
jgi:hypothetical protein